jgi:hypothetical protein
MLSRHKKIPTCDLCSNVEDLLVVGTSRLCENCRTCPHGNVHSSFEPEALCLECVRALFTDYTFVGPRISDMEEYVRWCRAHRLDRYGVYVWTSDEESEMLDCAEWQTPLPELGEVVDASELLRQK